MNKKYLIIVPFVILALSSFSVLFANNEKDYLCNETIKISRYGLTLKKPNKWIEPNESLIATNIKYLDDKDEKISEILKSHQGSIYVGSFHKYDPAKYPGIIPTINISIRKNVDKNFSSFIQTMDKSKINMSKILNNFKIIEDIKEIKISGKSIIFFSATFDLFVMNAGSFSIRSTVYAIPFDDSFLQISMSEELPEKNSKLFSNFINSLNIQ